MPAAAYESDQAFYADTMTYFQCLQFVLIPRVTETIAERGKFLHDAADLITLLSEFDDFSNGYRSGAYLS